MHRFYTHTGFIKTKYKNERKIAYQTRDWVLRG